MPQDMGPRPIINRASHLGGSGFVVETKSQEATQYIVIETPYRATQDDVDRAMRKCKLLMDVTGCGAEAVIASVKREKGKGTDPAQCRRGRPLARRQRRTVGDPRKNLTGQGVVSQQAGG